MASTTKIMTALTAFSIEGVQPSGIYTVVKADLVGEASMGLREGEQVSFESLLYGLFLNSGNDAAMAIAHYAGAKIPGDADSLQKFVGRMNQYAVELGMLDSSYANPHGLDAPGHFSSAYDLAISGWYALKNPLISQIMATPAKTVAGKNLVSLNPLLKRRPYSGANGIKPGFTDQAGLCLVASATRNGQTIISVTLGNNDQGYASEPPALLDFGFTQLKNQSVVEAIKQGATDPELYIGRPTGNRLLAFASDAAINQATTVIINTSPSSVINTSTEFDASVLTPIIQQQQQILLQAGINPAISGQGQGGLNAFQNAPVVNQFGTPNPTQTASPGGNSTDSSDKNTKQQSGGFNFFGLLLFILVAVGVFYIILRFTPAGGERGRQIAFQMEDMATAALAMARNGIQRLWQFVRPEENGNGQQHPEKIEQAAARYSKPLSSDSEREARAAEVINRPRTDYSNKPELGRNRSTGRLETENFEVNSPRPINRQQNPLGNFFDDDEPVTASYRQYRSETEPETDETDGEEIQSASATPLPPQPLPRVQSAAPAPRPATEAKPPVGNPNPAPVIERPNYAPVNQQPALNYNQNQNSYNTVAPNSAFNTDNTARAYQPERPSQPQPSPVQSAANLRQPSPDMLEMQARRAIDYAQAGRLVASTQEFRRVIEQEPLFDFGVLEEFVSMPVLGFKALANAYRDSGRLKFAVLLLEMSIEQYPNDLELRNLLRTLKREAGM